MDNKLDKMKNKRAILDIKTKRRILALVDSGLAHNTVAKQFNLGRSTVTKIVLNRKKILENDLGAPSNSIRRIRDNKIGILKNRLVKWCIGETTLPSLSNSNDNHNSTFKSYSSIEIRKGINSDHIISKAEEIAKELGIDNIQFTNSWVNKFRIKFNLKVDINWKKPGPTSKNLYSVNLNEPEKSSLDSIIMNQEFISENIRENIKISSKNLVVPSNFDENLFYSQNNLNNNTNYQESGSFPYLNMMDNTNFNQNEFYFQNNTFTNNVSSNAYEFQSSSLNTDIIPYQLQFYPTYSNYFNFPFNQ